MASKSINQESIAIRLGISVPTVSRALRGFPGISQSTREDVQRVARELGYGRAPAAKARTRRPQPGETGSMFAVLTRSPPDNISPPYLEGISRAAQSLGASVITHHATNAEAESMASSRDLPAIFEQGLVSGIILVHRWPERVVRWLTSRWHVISLIHVYPGLPVEVIDMDHEDGIWQLVQHLHGLGHRRFGFLGSCPDIAWAIRRYGGFRSSLMRLGAIGGIAVNVPTATLERFSDGWRAPLDEAVAHTRAGVTAWVCACAEAAVFFQQRLRDEGFAIPQQVSLSAFEVLRSIGTGITCLVPPFAEMGTLALERLATTTSGVPSCPRSCLPCRFQEGRTTGSAPSC